VTDFRQPWRRVEIGGRRFQLQIVDPSTAFELEPSLIDLLGETLSLFIAAPDHVIGAALQRSGKGSEADELYATFSNEDARSTSRTAEAICSLGKLLGQCIASAQLESGWVVRTFGRLVYGRLRSGEDYIDNARDWARAGFGPLAKWEVLATQIQQSFGPLWTRSPYKLRVEGRDYKVPQPTGVPMAARYAAELARAGIAASAREVLDTWTPVQMIEMTETQAYTAEVDRRAHEAAKAGK
jgi:hypothetical protein